MIRNLITTMLAIAALTVAGCSNNGDYSSTNTGSVVAASTTTPSVAKAEGKKTVRPSTAPPPAAYLQQLQK